MNIERYIITLQIFIQNFKGSENNIKVFEILDKLPGQNLCCGFLIFFFT